MKKNRREELDSIYSNLEHRLLSVCFSGVYISNLEWQKIADKIDLKYPSKTKEYILKYMLNEAKEKNKIRELLLLIIKALEFKIDEYIILGKTYTNSGKVIKQWIQKVQSTILLLNREINNYSK